jgi:hypothetical protein
MEIFNCLLYILRSFTIVKKNIHTLESQIQFSVKFPERQKKIEFKTQSRTEEMLQHLKINKPFKTQNKCLELQLFLKQASKQATILSIL